MSRWPVRSLEGCLSRGGASSWNRRDDEEQLDVSLHHLFSLCTSKLMEPVWFV